MELAQLGTPKVFLLENRSCSSNCSDVGIVSIG
jgi:hypothetical protein